MESTIRLPVTKAFDRVLHFALLLRFVTLLAALGAALGAVLMFWLGGVKLADAISFGFLPEAVQATSVVTAVMQATDAFLFGLVLVVFAYGITFGFAFDLPHAVRMKLPPWMRIRGISELKNALIEIILVYLIVDFATDVAELETHVSWDMLSMPVAILLIGGTLRLLREARVDDDMDAEVEPAGPTSAKQ